MTFVFFHDGFASLRKYETIFHFMQFSLTNDWTEERKRKHLLGVLAEKEQLFFLSLRAN